MNKNWTTIEDGLDYWVDTNKVKLEDVYEKIKPFFHGLTIEDVIKAAVNSNLLCVRLEGEPLMLCKKVNKIEKLPENKNPNAKVDFSNGKQVKLPKDSRK